jgi:predicted transcriptional regulator
MNERVFYINAIKGVDKKKGAQIIESLSRLVKSDPKRSVYFFVRKDGGVVISSKNKLIEGRKFVLNSAAFDAVRCQTSLDPVKGPVDTILDLKTGSTREIVRHMH